MEIKQLPYKSASRTKSWVSLEQINCEHWEVIDKITQIINSDCDNYNPKAINFARNILDFLLDWEFISWKQYDSVMMIQTTNDFEFINTKLKPKVVQGDCYTSAKYGGVSLTYIGHDSMIGHEIRSASTDRDFDRVHNRIFGSRPIFAEEMEGMDVAYRSDGSRYFALPTTNGGLFDYI